MKRNILLFLCAFLATIGVCAGVFMLLKHRANNQADEVITRTTAATPEPAQDPAPTPEPTPAPTPGAPPPPAPSHLLPA